MTGGRVGFLSMKVTDAFAHLLVVAMLACECSLFFLSSLPDTFFEICGYNVKYLSSLFAIFGFLIILLLSFRGKKLPNFAFGVPITAYVIICVAMTLVSSFAYGIALRSVLFVAMPSICIPLLYFALHGMVKNDRLYDFFIQTTIAFAVVYAALCLAEASGASIMNEAYQFTGIRNGRLRIIVSGDFVTFGAVLALGRAFATKKGRVLNSILFAIMAFELYWVAQTRFLLVALVVAAVFGFVFCGKNKVIKVLLVFIAALLFASLFSDDIASMLFPSDLDVSGKVRVYGYAYFWSHGADLGLFGLGFIPGGTAQASVLDVGSISGYGMGDITDVGIVGYFARYGVCGALLLALAVGSFLRAVHDRDGNSFKVSTNPEAWMALVLFITISPTMAITDAQRIFYLPILALMIEHALFSGAPSDIGGQRALSDFGLALLGGSLG